MRGHGVVWIGVIGWMVGACSDPGGGNNGVTDTAGDTIFSPTETLDGSGDTGASCTNGARQCHGQIAQQCVNGSFIDLFECPSGQMCEAGACKASDATDTGAPGDTGLPIDTFVPNDTGPTDTVEPDDPCETRECGPDGQGGSCGTCQNAETCNAQGQCVSQCVPDCEGRECGSDLCGGSCGTCPAFQQCLQGTCEPTETCDCGGAECGVDNCGNSCGTCGANETCSGAGLCVSTAAGGNCVDMLDCIYGDDANPDGCFAFEDETAFNACIDECYAASSDIGVAEFEAYLGCLQACPQPDGDPATTADDLAYDRCYYTNCSDDEAFCVLDASGFAGCFDILDCFDLCADGDGACYQACWESGSEPAQAALWGLDNCVSVECPDDDAACVDDALVGICADFVVDCQNN